MSVSSYGVTVTIEVGFDDGPFTPLDDVSWTDLTAHVRSWSISGGRASELATYSPGMATVVFNNRTRLFDSANTSGAYYGKLKPRRPLRITLTVGVTSWVLFTGYTRGWELSYPGTTDAVCTVACTDAFDVLAGARLPGSAYGAAVLADSPAYYWPLQQVDEASYSPAAAGGVDLTHGAVGSIVTMSNGYTLPLGEGGAVTGPGGLTATTSGNPVGFDLWVTDNGTEPDVVVGESVIVAGSTESITVYFFSADSWQIEYRKSSGGGYYVLGDSVPAPGWTTAGEPWHLAVRVSGTSVIAYANGRVWQTLTAASGTTSLIFTNKALLSLADGTYDVSHFAVYTSSLSAADVLAHYEAGTIAHGHPMGEAAGARIGRILNSVGWASADRDLSDGVTVLGPWEPGSYALNDIRALERVEQGLFFIAGDGKATFRDRTDQWTTDRMVTAQATFGDGPGETPLANPLRIDGNSIDYVRNSADVSYSSATITVKDDTSIAAYGEEPESIDASTLPDTAGWIARQLANYRVRLHKDPATRIPSVPIGLHEADGADTHVATVAALALGDRVAVNRRPDGATDPISLACRLEGFRWSWDPNGFDWTGYLAPCPPSAADGDYFVVGSSLVGGTDTTPY